MSEDLVFDAVAAPAREVAGDNSELKEVREKIASLEKKIEAKETQISTETHHELLLTYNNQLAGLQNQLVELQRKENILLQQQQQQAAAPANDVWRVHVKFAKGVQIIKGGRMAVFREVVSLIGYRKRGGKYIYYEPEPVPDQRPSEDAILHIEVYFKTEEAAMKCFGRFNNYHQMGNITNLPAIDECNCSSVTLQPEDELIVTEMADYKSDESPSPPETATSLTTDVVIFLEESDSLCMYQAVDAATLVDPHQAAHLIPKSYIDFIYDFPDNFWSMAHFKFGINRNDVDTLISHYDLNNANDHNGQSNFVAASMTFHKTAFDGGTGKQRSFGKKVGLRQEDPKKRPRISGGYGCGKPGVYLTCGDDTADRDPNFGNRYPVQVKFNFLDDRFKQYLLPKSGTVQTVSQDNDGQTIKTFYVNNKDIFVKALHFKAALNIYAYWIHSNMDIEQAVTRLRAQHISDLI